MSDVPITVQIRNTAVALLAEREHGMRTTELNRLIAERHPDFHPKTINGVVWRLCETNLEVHKPERGLFQLKRP